MPTIAITGGIASGKSTFTQIFRSLLDAPVFDTDACARRLLLEEPAVLAEIRAEFGSEVFDPAGQIDRTALRTVVFADRARRIALEGILHPRVRTAWQGWLESGLQNAPEAVLIVEIPLLYETGADKFFDQAIVVGCSLTTQVHRLVQNRQLSEEVARQIIASQWELAEKMRRCQHVVWNDGSKEHLHSQAKLCAGLYLLSGR